VLIQRPLTNPMKLIVLLAGLAAAVVMVASGFSVPPPGMGRGLWLMLALGGTVVGWAIILAIFDILAVTQKRQDDREPPTAIPSTASRTGTTCAGQPPRGHPGASG
jgi:hypothetical protein